MQLGENDRADDLLEGSLQVIKTLPLLGTNGYWITDVRILAMQNRRQLALGALRQAIDEEWQLLSWLYLEHDPKFDSIRGEPEFQPLYMVLKTDLADQARCVQDLKASGERPSTGFMQK